MDDTKRQQAIEAAMLLFWEQGAEGASYNEIVAATGLSRKALYAVWPDKDALVHDALIHYRQSVLAELLSPLDQGGAEGLTRFWDNLHGAIKTASNWTGCFLFRSASGPLRGDAFIKGAYEEYAGRMRAMVEACVSNGQAAGDLPSALEPKSVGWQVLALNGLLSNIGARSGYVPEVEEVFAVARESCGLS